MWSSLGVLCPAWLLLMIKGAWIRRWMYIPVNAGFYNHVTSGADCKAKRVGVSSLKRATESLMKNTEVVPWRQSVYRSGLSYLPAGSCNSTLGSSSVMTLRCRSNFSYIILPINFQRRLWQAVDLITCTPCYKQEEEDSDEDHSQSSYELSSATSSLNLPTDDHLCHSDEENEPAFVSPLDERKGVKQPALSMSNLHEATMWVPSFLMFRKTGLQLFRAYKATLE